ncbi:MAG: leucyl aminopeptidase [Leptothrix ochracea]|uniref:leucyl aminopeptidase n=1 Tax=Leptothrix ochracea TaxID=735331 RepID=UPI0034E1B5F0
MDFEVLSIASGALSDHVTDTLLLLVPADQARWTLPQALQAELRQAVDAGDLSLKTGQSLCLHRPAGIAAQRLVLSVAASAQTQAQQAAFAAGLALIKTSGPGTRTLSVAWGGDEPVVASAWAETLVKAVSAAVYVYRHTKPSATPAPRLTRVELLGSAAQVSELQAGVRQGKAIAAGIELAREWANRPGNHATPTHLAEQAIALGQAFKKLKVEVLDTEALAELGMGSFLAVAQGSEQPPKFIVLNYQGSTKKVAPLVLVGKGVTFDSGGISIKPSAEMDEMKFDMGGAASVLGTFRALAELQPKINVVGLIPACENLPSGRAVKPGDVVTSMSGTTIEILNTDAEGRLILCDALTYAERFKPAAVVDIATLTGACVIALGHHHSGLFSADEALATALQSAGESALDTAWRMPLDEVYDDGLKSNFADIANVGPRAGGSITAAMFLKRFTGAYRWAHLDIAGTAWKSGAAKGATGRPVGLLTHFVLAEAQALAARKSA